MPYAGTSDVAEVAKAKWLSGTAVMRNGSVVVGAAGRAATKPISGAWNADYATSGDWALTSGEAEVVVSKDPAVDAPTVTAIETKITDRFDDPTYYS
tara:strand:- start:434 stop:724 length:291 start_codon:yes stop_codon:yes gene_type:complete